MQRKLIKVGTSAAVIIPKTLLEEQGVKIGDTVYIQISKKKQKENDKKTVVDPKVIQWTHNFVKEYKGLLKRLADS